MKIIMRILFLLALVIILTFVYSISFSLDSFVKEFSISGFSNVKILFVLFFLLTIFHYITVIYCIIHMFRYKLSIKQKILYIFSLLFFPIIASFFYFEKYIFKKDIQ